MIEEATDNVKDARLISSVRLIADGVINEDLLFCVEVTGIFRYNW